MNRNATFKVYDRPKNQLSKYQQVANERFSDLYSLQPPDTSKQKYFTDNKKDTIKTLRQEVIIAQDLIRQKAAQSSTQSRFTMDEYLYFTDMIDMMVSLSSSFERGHPSTNISKEEDYYIIPYNNFCNQIQRLKDKSENNHAHRAFAIKTNIYIKLAYIFQVSNTLYYIYTFHTLYQ
jgi:hypothetical protein